MTTTMLEIPPKRAHMLDDLIGVSEAAEICKVSRQYLPMLAARRRTTGFPEPLLELKMGPLYSRSEVTRWKATRDAAKTAKRLVADANSE